MILNACAKYEIMIDENVCKICKDNECHHAGELTTRERIKEREHNENKHVK